MTVKTAGETLSWAALGLLGLGAFAQPMGCTTEVDGPSGEPSVLQRMLADVGPEVVIPTLERFIGDAEALASANEAWLLALQEGRDGEAERAEAQEAWRTAWLTWEELEVHQIGPKAITSYTVGAEGLRDEVYSWPTVSACLVDQKVADGSYTEEGFFTANRVNAYGLDALEYLLFTASDDNDCGASLSINTGGSWDALGDTVALRRAEMAVVVAEAAIVEGDVILERWESGFSEGMSAGEGSVYDSEQAALNAVFDAMFYLESTTKDRKLARPMGLRDCDTETCPEAVEAQWSGEGSAAIAANLRGFRTLFTGGEGTGMEELLVELGHGDLATSMLADVDEAIAAAEVLSDLVVELEQDPASVQVLHNAVVDITDAMKSDLTTILSVQIPAEFLGDTD